MMCLIVMLKYNMYIIIIKIKKNSKVQILNDVPEFIFNRK